MKQLFIYKFCALVVTLLVTATILLSSFFSAVDLMPALLLHRILPTLLLAFGVGIVISAFIAYFFAYKELDQIKKATEVLEQQEQVRRDFIANISHELKTPITSISGFSEAMMDGTIPPDRFPRYLKSINEESARMSRLILGMMDLTRYGNVNEVRKLDKTLELGELAQQALFNLESRALQSHVSFEVQLPEKAIYVFAERDSLSQVINNILVNAIKYSFPDTIIDFQIWRNDDKAFVSVKNHGNTIPRDELKLIFERFHKSDHSRSMDKVGLGIGLHIVKSIIDSYGETIDATSEDGETEFVFSLRVGGKENEELRKS
jgi:signal transduction histidine kinase